MPLMHQYLLQAIHMRLSKVEPASAEAQETISFKSQKHGHAYVDHWHVSYRFHLTDSFDQSFLDLFRSIFFEKRTVEQPCTQTPIKAYVDLGEQTWTLDLTAINSHAPNQAKRSKRVDLATRLPVTLHLLVYPDLHKRLQFQFKPQRRMKPLQCR
jgi:hypothetical protein